MGAPGARPSVQNLFNFMQFFGKIFAKLYVGVPPSPRVGAPSHRESWIPLGSWYFLCRYFISNVFTKKMHSSRIHTARFSGRGSFCPEGWRGCLSRGVYTPPVNRMTDKCKNITLPQLRLQAAIIEWAIYHPQCSCGKVIFSQISVILAHPSPVRAPCR